VPNGIDGHGASLTRLDSYGAVESYVRRMFRLSLDEVLQAACASGRLPQVLGSLVSVNARLDQIRSYSNGIMSSEYRGTLAVQGVSYRFVYHVFTKADGDVLDGDLQQLEPLGWQARIVIG
jgi:hypothetical protein